MRYRYRRFIAGSRRAVKKQWKKATASVVALAFLFTTLASPFAQANLWSDRKAAVAQMNRSNGAQESPADRPAYPQVAQLPASLQAMPELSNFSSNLDHIRGVPGQVFTDGNGAALSENEIQAGLQRMPATLRAIPSSYGVVRRVHLSKNPGAPLIVLVQDAHEIESAQRNIAGLLKHLHRDWDQLLVGIEGASGAFDIPLFRQMMQDKKALHSAADVMLQKSFISGADFYGLTGEKEASLWGVENEKVYMEHVNAYRESQRTAPEMRKFIASMVERLRPLKEKYYSPELLDYDRFLTEYSAGGGKVTLLLDYFAKQNKVSLKDYPQVTLLGKAAEIERTLDLKQVEKERSELIQILGRSLKKQDLEGLVQASLAYRVGQVGHASYYRYLKGILARNVRNAGSYEEFYRYMDYVLMTDRVDSSRLFDEIEVLKEKVLEALAETPQQKILARISENLRRMDKLVRFEMNPEEWKRYQKDRAAILNMDETLIMLGENFDAEGSAGKETLASARSFEEMLKGYEGFYDAALKRNKVMVDNLLAKMDKEGGNADLAVMIAGGFHTPGVEKEFAERGVSVVTVMPRIGQVDKATKYLDFFEESGTPIEKMLLGEKLMVAPNPALAPMASFKSFSDTALAFMVALYVAIAVRFSRDPIATLKNLEKSLIPDPEKPELKRPLESLSIERTDTETVVVKAERGGVQADLTLSFGPLAEGAPAPTLNATIQVDGKEIPININRNEPSIWSKALTFVVNMGARLSRSGVGKAQAAASARSNARVLADSWVNAMPAIGIAVMAAGALLLAFAGAAYASYLPAPEWTNGAIATMIAAAAGLFAVLQMNRNKFLPEGASPTLDEFMSRISDALHPLVAMAIKHTENNIKRQTHETQKPVNVPEVVEAGGQFFRQLGIVLAVIVIGSIIIGIASTATLSGNVINDVGTEVSWVVAFLFAFLVSVGMSRMSVPNISWGKTLIISVLISAAMTQVYVSELVNPGITGVRSFLALIIFYPLLGVLYRNAPDLELRNWIIAVIFTAIAVFFFGDIVYNWFLRGMFGFSAAPDGVKQMAAFLPFLAALLKGRGLSQLEVTVGGEPQTKRPAPGILDRLKASLRNSWTRGDAWGKAFPMIGSALFLASAVAAAFLGGSLPDILRQSIINTSFMAAAALFIFNRMKLDFQPAAVLQDLRGSVREALAPLAVFFAGGNQYGGQPKEVYEQRAEKALGKAVWIYAGIIILVILCVGIPLAIYMREAILMNMDLIKLVIKTTAVSAGMALLWAGLKRLTDIDHVWVDLPFALGIMNFVGLFFGLSVFTTLSPFFLTLAMISVGAIVIIGRKSRAGNDRGVPETMFWGRDMRWFVVLTAITALGFFPYAYSFVATGNPDKLISLGTTLAIFFAGTLFLNSKVGSSLSYKRMNVALSAIFTATLGLLGGISKLLVFVIPMLLYYWRYGLPTDSVQAMQGWAGALIGGFSLWGLSKLLLNKIYHKHDLVHHASLVGTAAWFYFAAQSVAVSGFEFSHAVVVGAVYWAAVFIFKAVNVQINLKDVFGSVVDTPGKIGLGYTTALAKGLSLGKISLGLVYFSEIAFFGLFFNPTSTALGYDMATIIAPLITFFFVIGLIKFIQSQNNSKEDETGFLVTAFGWIFAACVLALTEWFRTWGYLICGGMIIFAVVAFAAISADIKGNRFDLGENREASRSLKTQALTWLPIAASAIALSQALSTHSEVLSAILFAVSSALLVVSYVFGVYGRRGFMVGLARKFAIYLNNSKVPTVPADRFRQKVENSFDGVVIKYEPGNYRKDIAETSADRTQVTFAEWPFLDIDWRSGSGTAARASLWFLQLGNVILRYLTFFYVLAQEHLRVEGVDPYKYTPYLTSQSIKYFFTLLFSSGLSNFRIPLFQFTKIMKDFGRQIAAGIAGNVESLAMIDSFASQPTGKETGKFVTVDWGGTNVRVHLVELQGDGKTQELLTSEFQFSAEELVGEGAALFDRIAEKIGDVVARDPQKQGDEHYKVGFIFSFNATLNSIRSAKLNKWTKEGINPSGVVGEDVVELLEAALSRKELSKAVSVAAVANDTVGTQVTGTYKLARKGVKAVLGVILGTGFNISADIGGKLYNMESGNFDGVIPVMTAYDEMLDDESEKPGEQLLEKMISGKYLGELLRLRIGVLVKEGKLSSAWNSPALSEKYKADTTLLSAIERNDSDELKAVLKGLGVEAYTDEEIALLQPVCEEISSRSAELFAAVLAASLKKIDPKISKDMTVAIDGSVWQKYGLTKAEWKAGNKSLYQQRVEEALVKLLGEKASRVKFEFTEGGTAIGGAIMAATAPGVPVLSERIDAAILRQLPEGQVFDRSQTFAQIFGESASASVKFYSLIADLKSQVPELSSFGHAADYGDWQNRSVGFLVNLMERHVAEAAVSPVKTVSAKKPVVESPLFTMDVRERARQIIAEGGDFSKNFNAIQSRLNEEFDILLAQDRNDYIGTNSRSQDYLVGEVLTLLWFRRGKDVTDEVLKNLNKNQLKLFHANLARRGAQRQVKVAARDGVGIAPSRPRFSLTREAVVEAAFVLENSGYRGAARNYPGETEEKIKEMVKTPADGLAFRVIQSVFNSYKAAVWIFNSEGWNRDGVEQSFIGGTYMGPDGWRKFIAGILRALGIADFLGIHAAVLSMDVIEGTNSFASDNPIFSGATSVAVSGKGVESLGQFPDLYADLIVAHVPKEKAAEFKERPLDFNDHVIANLNRIADANGLSRGVRGDDYSGMEVVIVGRERERSRLRAMLPNISPLDIQRAVESDKNQEVVILEDPKTHLKVTVIPDGTFLPAVRIGLGEQLTEGRIPLYYGSSGSAEAMMNLQIAAGSREEGAVAAMQLMSSEGLKKKGADVENRDGAFEFSPIEKEGEEGKPGILEQRKGTKDAEAILSGQKTFSLWDVKGDVDASIAFLTDNPAWDQPGVRTEDGMQKVRVLRIGHKNGRGYHWIEEIQRPSEKHFRTPGGKAYERGHGLALLDEFMYAAGREQTRDITQESYWRNMDASRRDFLKAKYGIDVSGPEAGTMAALAGEVRDAQYLSPRDERADTVREWLGLPLNPWDFERASENRLKIYMRLLAGNPSQLIPGVRSFLEKANEKVAFFLATGGMHRNVDFVLSQVGILDYFKGKIFASPMLKGNALREVLGSVSGNVVFIGDTPNDMEQAGSVRNTRVVRIFRGEGYEGALAVNDFTQLEWTQRNSRQVLIVHANDGRTVEIDNVGAVVSDMDGTLVLNNPKVKAAKYGFYQGAIEAAEEGLSRKLSRAEINEVKKIVEDVFDRTEGSPAHHQMRRILKDLEYYALRKQFGENCLIRMGRGSFKTSEGAAHGLKIGLALLDELIDNPSLKARHVVGMDEGLSQVKYWREAISPERRLELHNKFGVDFLDKEDGSPSDDIIALKTLALAVYQDSSMGANLPTQESSIRTLEYWMNSRRVAEEAPVSARSNAVLSPVPWDDLQLIISDLFGTLVKVKVEGTQKVADVPESLVNDVDAHLKRDGLFVVDTGDMFHNARDWFVNKLEQDANNLRKVVVLSLSSMVGHWYNPASNQFETLFTLLDFLNDKQRKNWDDFHSLWLKTVREEAEKNLGKFLRVEQGDGEMVYIYQKGQVEDRNFQVTLRVNESKKQKEIAGRIHARLEDRFAAIDFMDLGFDPRSTLLQSDGIIDMLPIPWHKGMGLRKLIETGVLDRIAGKKIDFTKTELWADTPEDGNDQAMTEVEELAEAPIISVRDGVADKKRKDIHAVGGHPRHLAEYFNQKRLNGRANLGPKGVPGPAWHAGQPASRSAVSDGTEEKLRSMRPAGEKFKTPKGEHRRMIGDVLRDQIARHPGIVNEANFTSRVFWHLDISRMAEMKELGFSFYFRDPDLEQIAALAVELSNAVGPDAKAEDYLRVLDAWMGVEAAGEDVQAASFFMAKGYQRWAWAETPFVFALVFLWNLIPGAGDLPYWSTGIVFFAIHPFTRALEAIVVTPGDWKEKRAAGARAFAEVFKDGNVWGVSILTGVVGLISVANPGFAVALVILTAVHAVVNVASRETRNRIFAGYGISIAAAAVLMLVSQYFPQFMLGSGLDAVFAGKNALETAAITAFVFPSLMAMAVLAFVALVVAPKKKLPATLEDVLSLPMFREYIKNRMQSRPELVRGADFLLEDLDGVPCFLASGSQQGVVESELERQGIGHRFTGGVYAAGKRENAKSKIEVIKEALSLPGEGVVFFVTDGAYDIRTALQLKKKYGDKLVIIHRISRENESTARHIPGTVFVRDLSDINRVSNTGKFIVKSYDWVTYKHEYGKVKAVVFDYDGVIVESLKEAEDTAGKIACAIAGVEEGDRNYKVLYDIGVHILRKSDGKPATETARLILDGVKEYQNLYKFNARYAFKVVAYFLVLVPGYWLKAAASLVVGFLGVKGVERFPAFWDHLRVQDQLPQGQADFVVGFGCSVSRDEDGRMVASGPSKAVVDTCYDVAAGQNKAAGMILTGGNPVAGTSEGEAMEAYWNERSPNLTRGKIFPFMDELRNVPEGEYVSTAMQVEQFGYMIRDQLKDDNLSPVYYGNREKFPKSVIVVAHPDQLPRTLRMLRQAYPDVDFYPYNAKGNVYDKQSTQTRLHNKWLFGLWNLFSWAWERSQALGNKLQNDIENEIAANTSLGLDDNNFDRHSDHKGEPMPLDKKVIEASPTAEEIRLGYRESNIDSLFEPFSRHEKVRENLRSNMSLLALFALLGDKSFKKKGKISRVYAEDFVNKVIEGSLKLADVDDTRELAQRLAESRDGLIEIAVQMEADYAKDKKKFNFEKYEQKLALALGANQFLSDDMASLLKTYFLRELRALHGVQTRHKKPYDAKKFNDAMRWGEAHQFNEADDRGLSNALVNATGRESDEGFWRMTARRVNVMDGDKYTRRVAVFTKNPEMDADSLRQSALSALQGVAPGDADYEAIRNLLELLRENKVSFVSYENYRTAMDKYDVKRYLEENKIEKEGLLIITDSMEDFDLTDVEKLVQFLYYLAKAAAFTIRMDMTEDRLMAEDIIRTQA